MDNSIKLPKLTSRDPAAHKGRFGKILIVGGSRAMPGAAALAAWSALRSGAGLVKVAAPVSALSSIAAYSPCYTLLPCAETKEGTLSPKALPKILAELAATDIVALGPGISTHDETRAAVWELIAKVDRPLVIDADGLNIAAEKPDRIARSGRFCVLTPHPGEFARLDGSQPPGDEAGRVEAAQRLARNTGTTVLLKGRGTVVTDGSKVFVNQTGNPGMATAGSGDVLTGMIASLLFQLAPGLEAVALAAHLHGLAGDLAASDMGEISVTAGDIADRISHAVRQYREH